MQNLVIVESPAKAKTIEKFLGEGYTVMSSYGHVRDLSKKEMSVDIEHNFEPKYEISPDKKELVSNLKRKADEADIVWLASDEDREGEAIAWHLSEVLKLDKNKTKRIVFHEITKDAILNAIANPRDIDNNLVSAQQARRVLDRIVGFEISPILWRKVKPNLSAGRVQSVTVRLVADREQEILSCNVEPYYRIEAFFEVSDSKGKKTVLKAECDTKFKTEEEARKVLENCSISNFMISDINVRPAKKSPAPPFTTSTLQQEAARKLGFTVAQTMSVAQHLYEDGKITYMRTDSVNLSSLALNTAKNEILSMAGEKYAKTRQYHTNSKGAQEAHEAIRPTYINNHTIEGTSQEKKLYDLIWKRTIASQMADAEFERTTVTITADKDSHKFVAEGEVITFDGFLKVYMESTDDESESKTGSKILPPLTKGQAIDKLNKIVATQKFSQKPARYTEASLVHKLEELGIGRPSTYAPTISTIQARGYVEKGDKSGTPRNYRILTLENGSIKCEEKTEMTGAEKGKLLPTDIGNIVNTFLLEHFPDIMDFNFTANVEKTFDDVAEGTEEWQTAIGDFYKGFHPLVEKSIQSKDKMNGERCLGTDPVSHKPVYVKIARFGPVVQIGSNEDEDKPKFASLRKDQHLDTITLEDAIDLFKLPRTVGMYEGEEMVVAVGRFGPYIKHKSLFYTLSKTDDPMTITESRGVEVIEAKRNAEKNKHISTFEIDGVTVEIINGRYGPYITANGNNYKISKGTDATKLTAEDCKAIMSDESNMTKSSSKTKKKTTASETETKDTKKKSTSNKKSK